MASGLFGGLEGNYWYLVNEVGAYLPSLREIKITKSITRKLLEGKASYVLIAHVDFGSKK